ncbi:unnamed protein product, partial [Nesidiocoris tenuis]
MDPTSEGFLHPGRRVPPVRAISKSSKATLYKPRNPKPTAEFSKIAFWRRATSEANSWADNVPAEDDAV